ncbi:MAG: preprotein translocase subunit SecA, partial [Anaerolineae bacterium]|nr:preprotein translocase subunit SecA [Anaerolineae bacterium]
GEGKTLVATLPAYLNALSGQGVHIVTVNDYLAQRDADWMGKIYRFLGLTVGVNLSQMEHAAKQEAYAADITYGTNNEFGFDYLRDNMAVDMAQLSQRELNYAIVDEIDNILIDEARTPLIISGPAQESSDHYRRFAQLVPRLHEEDDYKIDEKDRIVTLTDEGLHKIERWVGVPEGKTLYEGEYAEMAPYLDNALRAQVLFKRDKDYVVQDGEVLIVDEFTGRLMYGRRYSEGLHQAIEAKEGVSIRRENLTLATITFQNFFRMYRKLAGMTGTAATEKEEFGRIYNLEVTAIPTNVPTQRSDNADQVYKSQRAKFNAVLEEVVAAHERGQPVLLGASAIETSEFVSNLLRRRGIDHNVLNAKNHEREAVIIAQAGRPGAVTIATNMAGRGVDILLGGNAENLAREELRKREFDLNAISEVEWNEALDMLRKGQEPTARFEGGWAGVLAEQWRRTKADGDRVRAVGGLYVIGSERHEARRIDNQLRGRAGRQGDPGSSRFYVALDDELMVRFGGQNVAGLMDRLGLEEDVPIEHRMVSGALENSQVKVEGYNFDLRKHLLQYDDVINQQRAFIYQQRTDALSKTTLRPTIMGMIEKELDALVDQHTQGDRSEWDMEGLLRDVQRVIPIGNTTPPAEWGQLYPDQIKESLVDLAEQTYDLREQEFGPEMMREIERAVLLRAIDNRWIHHLTALDELRQGIGLRAYAQQDPVVTYRREAFAMFGQLTDFIQEDVARLMLHVAPETSQPPARRVAMPRATRYQGAGGQTTTQAAPSRKPAGSVLGRNDPCPCGSGKKFKQCHMGREAELVALLQKRGQAAMAAMAQPAAASNATRTAPPPRRDGKDSKSKRR